MTSINQFNPSRSGQDTAWKEILDCYFKDFVHYCLHDLVLLIDWDKPIISLDKELQAITKGSGNGKRLLDKLFKVFLKEGHEQWILIHIEIQGKKEEAFAKRMFTYAYRIWDKYQQALVNCALLTDANKNWRPSSYEVKCAGSKLRSEFITIKLLDYQNKKTELENSDNVFASVILVQLAAIESQSQSAELRKNIKFALTKRLYDKGFSRQEISNLYRFIDWLIGLPLEFEVDYLSRVYELEEARNMPYISTAEKIGIEKGIEKKALEDAQAMLHEGCDPAFIAKITQLTIEQIKALQTKK